MEPDASRGLATLPAAERLPGSARPVGGTAAPTDAPAAGLAADSFLYRLLTAARERDYRRGFYTLAAFLATLVLLLNLRGPCLQTHWGHDSIGFLNAAWKVRCGVLPHADYTSALGALNPWILAAGMSLLGPTAAVLPFCIGLVAAGTGVLAFVVARSRLPAVLAVIFAFTQTVVASAPHLLRFPWDTATYDGYYNRQGYALVSVLLLLLFLPAAVEPADRARRERWDGRLAGGLLGVLLFLKVSYFMAGGGLCALAFLLARRSSRSWCGNVLVGFAVVGAACLPLIRFDLLAMWRDLHLAADVRMENPEVAFRLGRYLRALPDAWVEVVLLAAISLVLAPPWLFRRRSHADSPGRSFLASGDFFQRAGASPPDAGDSTPSWAEFVGVVAISAFVCMTNAVAGVVSETPLLTSWLFVLLGAGLRSPDGHRVASVALWMKRRMSVLCVLACLLWVYTYGASLRNLVWYASPWPTPWQRDALALSPPFESDSLRDLRMMLWAGEEHILPMCYSEKINDGLKLLRALGGTHRVDAFDFVNPFPFALEWPATRGGAWCWHDGYSFNAAHHPSPAQAFGDADILMFPMFPGHLPSYLVMIRIYGPYLKEHFEQVSQSGQWMVLRRK